MLRQPLHSCALMLLAVSLGCTSRGGTVYVAAAGNWRTSFGTMSKHGIDLAAAEVNARGGVGGKRLDVLVADDSSDGSTAVSVASGFFNNPQVLGVVGHLESGPMMAAASVYDQGLVAISPTATSPALSGLSPWVYRVISSDSMNGRDIAGYAKRLGLKRAMVLYENNAYGRGLADAFVRDFDGGVIGSDPISADSSGDVMPNVVWAQRQRPDLVFVAGTSNSGIALLQAARRAGMKAVFMGGDGWSGVTAAGLTAEDVLVAAPFSAADSRPEVQRFVRAFRAKFGVDPDANAALAYDATQLLAQAIEQAGTSRLAVRDWIHDQLAGAPYIGVTGSIQFTPSGDVVGRSFTMLRVRNGRLIVEGATRGN